MFLDRYLITMAPVYTGAASVSQLENSDSSYLYAMSVMQSYPSHGLSLAVLFAVLGAIWFMPLMRKFGGPLAIVIGVGLLSTPAFSYYDTKDFPEYIEIAPNQSAFLIPVTGANKDSQGQFGSAEYLNSAKVPLKRVQIPHTLIRNPGWSYDYYVPSAKLVIVDRSPFQREWADGSRGTSTKDEGFHCDTADGIDFHINVTAAATVREEDTALFLYNFGVKPVATSADPAGNFGSVAYGRSLSEVMDTVVRAAVQSDVCINFGALKVSEIEGKKTSAITLVEKSIKERFIKKGITVDFIGMSSGINFGNPAVQKAMDELAITDMDALKATKLTPTLPYMQAYANIEFQKNLGIALQKWNGAVPSLPAYMSNETFTGLSAAAKNVFGSLTTK